MRTLMVTTGTLRGQTQEATRTLTAIKVSLPVALDVFGYVEFSIENVSKELPEGIYHVSAT